ncbi:MAG: hypothetical protein AB7N54_20170 [Alphaproteobacteria bacterium]
MTATDALAAALPPPVMIPYQQRLVASTALHRVLVLEKSRRIGASWAAAEAAVETSAAGRDAGGMDTLYIGYNLDMAREFIGDCAFWARHLSAFAHAVGTVEEFVFEDDNDRKIQAFRIAFDSGFAIVALSSRPRSLRGRQGFVIVDEAAFHDDLAGLLKAALALLMWGGRVWVLSTHFGADNPFNELVEEVRAGKRPYGLMRVTFDDAVKEGLYRRICLVTGKAWTQAGEDAWVAEIRAFYGDDAAEELDVVPAASEGVWLTRALIKTAQRAHHVIVARAFPDGWERTTPVWEREADVHDWLEERVGPPIAALDRNAFTFAGGDFARSGDLSVVNIGQLLGPTLAVPLTIELRNCPFAQQRQVIEYVFGRLPRFIKAALDARGLGAQLSEEAGDVFGHDRIEQVKATIEWYRENMPPLKTRFEDGTIEIADDADTVNDLRLVKLVRGVPMIPENARTMRSARGGQRHGDGAISLALLAYAAEQEAIEYGYEPAPRVRPRTDERVGASSGRTLGPPRNDDDFAPSGSKGAW